MTDIQQIAIAAIGSTGLWKFLEFLIANHRKKKFDMNQAVQDIQKDLVAMQDNQASMQRSIASLSASVAEDQAITARVRILSFGDDMMAGRDHSKDAFDQVLGDIDRYDHYCETHPHFKNNQTAMTRSLILDQYKECEREGTFLQYIKRK